MQADRLRLAAHFLLSGKLITSPPMTSPTLKSDFGLLGCELWHSTHAAVTATSA